MKVAGKELEDFFSAKAIANWMIVTGLSGWSCGGTLIYVFGKEEKQQSVNWLVAAIIAILPIPFLILGSEGYGIVVIANVTWILLSAELLVIAPMIFRKKQATQNRIAEP